MNWNKGFTATYYAYLIDPVTWRETQRLEITGGSITRNLDGLRDGAELTVKGFSGSERWVRVYLDAEQNGSAAHVPLFTGLASSPTRDIDGDYELNSLQCYSVLKPASDILLERGWYAPVDISGGLIIKNLLSVIPSEVSIPEDCPALRQAIIAEDGETNLSMVDKVLSAINYRIRLLGDGTVEVAPVPVEAVVQLDPLDNDIVELSVSIERDWYDCPNVFRAVQGDNVAIARDDRPESALSTVARSREIWAEETNVSLNTGEGLTEYANRRLKELQYIQTTAEYTRRFIPDVLAGDIIRLHYTGQGLDGLFRITSQSIEIGYGATTSEEVESYE